MTTGGRILYFALESNLKLYDSGIIMKRKRLYCTMPKKVGGLRKSIYGFSYQSRQRLRRKLLVSALSVPFVQFGLTFTVPGDVGENCLKEFKALCNRFFKSVTRQFPFHGIVYRVELQTRGMPHLHAVVYAPVARNPVVAYDPATAFLGADRDGREVLYKELFEKYRMLWLKALSLWDGRDKIKGAFRRAVHFDPLSSASAIRYLCDHQSKKKQAQLGYQGKQWGVVGGRNLIEVPAFKDLDLSAKQTGVFLRFLSRLRAGTVKAPEKPFGRVVSRNKRYRTGGVLYNDQGTVQRLLGWVLSDYPKPVRKGSIDGVHFEELPD